MNGCLFFLGPIGWIIIALRNNRKANVAAIQAGYGPYAVQRNALVLNPRFPSHELADGYRLALISQGVRPDQVRVVTVR